MIIRNDSYRNHSKSLNNSLFWSTSTGKIFPNIYKKIERVSVNRIMTAIKSSNFSSITFPKKRRKPAKNNITVSESTIDVIFSKLAISSEG